MQEIQVHDVWVYMCAKARIKVHKSSVDTGMKSMRLRNITIICRVTCTESISFIVICFVDFPTKRVIFNDLFTFADPSGKTPFYIGQVHDSTTFLHEKDIIILLHDR